MVRRLFNIFKLGQLPAGARIAVLAPGVAFCLAFLLSGWLSSAAVAAIAIALAVIGAACLREHADPKPLAEAPPDMPTAVLEGISDAVLILDSDRAVIVANRAARDLLGDNVVGRDLALSLRHPEALDVANKAIEGQDDGTAEIVMHVPVQRVFVARAVPLQMAGQPRFLLALQEVTAARNAEQIRADFVANVSHELRSPLSSLVGFIETLQNAAHDDEAARDRFLGIMSEESHRMARLIDDLLSLSRVEANEHVRPGGQLDIAAILTGVADSVSVQAEEKGMAIELIDLEAQPTIVGDQDELIEVFHNLLVNAIKYGHDNTTVRVAVSTVDRIPEVGGRGISVAVIDKGDGIAAEDVPRLTERFYRVDKGRSRSMGGTGLGLAIVKHIVNRHRGRLVIRSEVGAGSQFIVYLPVFAPAADQQTP
ncbi:MAG: PAS domain-containing protein [Alphaproteobacteria bacterium]|nr:PAS domain-containing protein [Alphaproteobacteria bacterium]